MDKEIQEQELNNQLLKNGAQKFDKPYGWFVFFFFKKTKMKILKCNKKCKGNYVMLFLQWLMV